MIDLKVMTPEELKDFIHKAEKELVDRAVVQVKEKKAKAATAIRELIAVCRSAGVYRLGNVYWECSDCDEGNYFDILGDNVLEDVVNLLDGK